MAHFDHLIWPTLDVDSLLSHRIMSGSFATQNNGLIAQMVNSVTL
jgi:hypothetical protein